MRLRFFVIILLSLLNAAAFAQGEQGQDVSFWQKVKLFIDSTDVKGCNLEYIQPQKYPWAIHLSFLPSATEVHPTIKEGPSAELYSKVKMNLAARISYRGYGMSYSRALSNASEQEFSFSNYSARFGFELRSHQSNSLGGTLKADSSVNIPHEYKFKVERGMLKETNFLINAYYVFNYKKFSYPAALSGSVRQIKSGGSPLACISYYQCTITSHDDSLSFYWNNISKIRLRQLSIGGGYGYNWVLGNGSFLLHASIMPLLGIFQRNKLYAGDSEEEIKNDWLSGGSSQTEENQTEDWRNNWLSKMQDKAEIRLTAVSRISFSYTLSERVIVGSQIVYNRHDIGSTEGFRIVNNDWMGNCYIGIRF